MEDFELHIVTNTGGIAMVTCPKCGCGECKKDGIVKGRQRHKCKSCGYRHTVTRRQKPCSQATGA